MPVLKQYLTYTFEELSEPAKQKAREWYREGYPDHDWWEFIYEDAMRMAEILGIDIDYRYHAASGRPGSKSWQEPKIWFSGFWSQGDGACWEGTYRYKPGSVKAIASEAPERHQYGKPDGTTEWTENAGNKELNRIAKALQDVQKPFFYKLVASVHQSGRYSHSGCMSVSVGHADDRYRDIGDAEDEIKGLMRDFADWIYDRLEQEHSWLTSDEQVDESIISNGHMFNECGRWEG